MESRRITARPARSFEPVSDAASPQRSPPVARSVRVRDPSAAASIPPLDPDQVLDLQRTAGNRLTSAALARWTEPPEAAD